MNPYYATGFLTALYFWIWPVFLYQTLAVPALVAAAFAALIVVGLGRGATEIHARLIAGQPGEIGRRVGMVAVCALIVLIGYLTRLGYQSFAPA